MRNVILVVAGFCLLAVDDIRLRDRTAHLEAALKPSAKVERELGQQIDNICGHVAPECREMARAAREASAILEREMGN